MGEHMSDTWTDFEKYLIARIDKLEEKVTDMRIKIAGMAVIISLATSMVTATIVSKSKAMAAQPAILNSKEK